MKSVFKDFLKLKEKIDVKSDSFNIIPLPNIINHKIGISNDGLPLFFIQCEEVSKSKFIDYNLEFISVQFNRECQLISNEIKISQGCFTLIALKTENENLQEYFIEVLYLVIKKLGSKPLLKELKVEIDNLTALFNKCSKPAKKSIQGLWAELVVIEQSKNPYYLLDSWHINSQDKYDFNDGKDKIEVKSTSKSRRIHSFSIEQLNPNQNSNLVIASIFAIETGVGKSINEIINLIKVRIKDEEKIIKLNSIVLETLGEDIDKIFEIFFDYQHAIDTKAFFDYENVPKIEISNLRTEISNVHFDSDLTNVKQLSGSSTNSILHQALFSKT